MTLRTRVRDFHARAFKTFPSFETVRNKYHAFLGCLYGYGCLNYQSKTYCFTRQHILINIIHACICEAKKTVTNDNFVVFPYINIVIFCRNLLALNPDSEFEGRKYFSPLRVYFKRFSITIIAPQCYNS
jgi:hypothetical protein